MDRRAAGRGWSVALLAVALAVFTGGCLDRDLKPLNPCLVSGVAVEIAVQNIDKVDMLFMVDNSGSMREEQAALRAQFVNMVTVLTTGDRSVPPDGMADFPPATDLHLAVVSSDMGLYGITGIPNCDNFGDDGVMQTAGNTALAGCIGGYPPFISYVEGEDAVQKATDFGCVSSLGTEGCGFEQQLEATLKAVWPASDRGGNGAMDINAQPMATNRISFVGDAVTGQGTTGHGDGANVGFLRNDPTMGLSLVAVILVSDEEDCSSRDLRHFTPPQFLDPNDPLAQQDLNLRCFFNPTNLYDVQRYVDGLQALRPDAHQLVIFAAIVGVPVDLVDATARDGVDFSDMVAREAYYQKILTDPRMIETPDPTRTPEQGGNLTPSCQVDNNDDGMIDSRAYPPRRIVEVAKRFGANGVVQSICQKDFAPAMDAIIEVIAKQLGAVCLPRELVPDADGKVGCDVVWELPKVGTAPASSPTSCGQRPFLEPFGSDNGREICKVTQLPVMNRTIPPNTLGEGWYYDNFSMDVQQGCPASTPQRVAFSAGAKPPTGVTVKLECLNETQSLVSTRTDIMVGAHVYQPTIGSPCKQVEWPKGQDPPVFLAETEVCATTLSNGMKEYLMECHDTANVCVRPCNANSDCPAAWVCDDRPETQMEAGTSFCVNPTCGDSEDK